MRKTTRRGLMAVTIGVALTAAATETARVAQADNTRLNHGVVANVYTIQHQAGCANDVRINPQLQLAAQRRADDIMHNRALDADVGSDGSMPQDRANAAGFHGKVAETVAINPALAISGMDILNRWYNNPDYLAIMRNCANTLMGVWSENGGDRSVVVALYGQPSDDSQIGLSITNPNPDYDASDELEFGLRWLPWILRGVYPPPGYPPQ